MAQTHVMLYITGTQTALAYRRIREIHREEPGILEFTCDDGSRITTTLPYIVNREQENPFLS
jgi:hypothetical protein